MQIICTIASNLCLIGRALLVTISFVGEIRHQPLRTVFTLTTLDGKMPLDVLGVSFARVSFLRRQ